MSNFIEAKGKFSNINGNLWIRSGITHFKANAGEGMTHVKDRFFAPVAFEDPFGAVTTVVYDTESFTGNSRNNDGYYLYIKSSTDAIDNKVQIDVFNYRTMAPIRMIDQNANPSSVLTDELGLVKAIALEGNGIFTDVTRTDVNIIQPADSLSGLREYTEATETVNIEQLFGSATPINTNTNQLRQAGNNLLQGASVRFVYDFDTYHNTGNQPVAVASIAREEHFAENNNSKVQFSFEYSDGLGNIAMTKVQAEPGVAYYMENGQRVEKDTAPDLRWIGNGRTVLNNKGNPVKQYEPYFSTNFGYEDAPELVEIGVTPLLYYDSLGRLIKTEFPDGTLSRVKFDSWKQIIFDQNDTVLESDWYDDRINNLIDARLIAQGKDPSKEKHAAQKAVAHAGTPSSVYLDSLGRPVLSIAHNGKDAEAKDRLYTTFIELDIEGNAKSVNDARATNPDNSRNPVMFYKYDILGHRVYQNSMNAGERWVLNNLMGNLIHRWDSRDQVFSLTYDVIQRPESIKVQGGDGVVPLNHVYERTIYGEGQANEYQHNLRGQLFQQYDTAGRVQSLQFDFKGNVLESTREFNANYKEVPNWIPANLNNAALFDADLTTYTTRTQYDALNRAINTITPDQSETRPVFNDAGLLEQVRVQLSPIGVAGPGAEKIFVKNIDYDAKGHRERIVYGDRNGNNLATTTYQYDEETFRLLHLRTVKPNGNLLQDLYYTYDPVGNISEIEDKAIPTRFFGNHKIEPKGLYQYDSLYRLIKAEGKEHAGQAINFGSCDNWKDQNFLKSYNPGDDMAWRKYTQKYIYDPVGNILETNHDATGGNWTRQYEYETGNNRLFETQVGGQTYSYHHHPEHGFIQSLPHLSVMTWNFKDELQATARQVICNNNNSPETTWYVYDAGGQRVRKITETIGGGRKKEERLYLGEMEIYKKHSGNHRGLERITLHVMDDSRRIAMVDTRNGVIDGFDQRTVRFQFSNHLGSASLEMDDLGEVINYEEYHPYGTTSYQAVNKDIKVTAKRYRYTGMERDEESGLEYHSARYYLSWLGRWLSSDPIGIGDGINLYRFGRGNPIMFSDINGTYCDPSVQSCPSEEVVPTAREEALQMSLPEDERHTPPVSFEPESPSSPSPRPRSTGRTIAPPPPVSPTDYTLYVPEGFVYQQYQAATREADNPDNSFGVRAGFFLIGLAAGPLALVEEYVARPVTNIPFIVHNAGIGIGEHSGRAYLWSKQGETGEAVLEWLHVVKDASTGFVAAASVGVPVAGATESAIARRTSASVTAETTAAGAVATETSVARSVAPSVRPTGFGGYRATFGGDSRALVAFEPQGSAVHVSDIFRGAQPRGSAGQMVADSLTAVGHSNPSAIRITSIIHEPTLTSLASGTPASGTVLGRTLTNTISELGGTITGWRTGVYRGKTWIEAVISYP